MKTIGNLQLITQNLPTQTTLELSKKYLEGGGRWIQLRMKDVPENIILDTAFELKNMCEEFQAKLIINDNHLIALKSNADGVHLGKNDIAPSEARKVLGNNSIIGGTANTFEDVIYLYNERVDYIGLGPFRYTTTKKNLSPILGKEGYLNIVNKMKNFGIDIPIVAIGGIELNDISSLVSTGINGIALSSLIAKNSSPTEITKKIINELK